MGSKLGYCHNNRKAQAALHFHSPALILELVASRWEGGNPRMRVLYVNHTGQPSGAGISLATLLRHLPVDVEKFFLLPTGSAVDELLGAGPQQTYHERLLCQFMTTRYTAQYPPWLFAWHFAKLPRAILRIRSLVGKWKINLVHVNETTLVAYALAARLAGVPVVLHARTAIAPRPFEVFLLRRFAERRRARIACIDPEVRDSLPRMCQRIAEVIYNPVDLGPTPSAIEVASVRAAWGCGLDDVIVGQVASLHRQKGIWLILRLAERLCPEFAKLRVVLIGNDSAAAGEGPELRQAVRERGLADRVIFAGYETRLALVYAALDVALCLFAGELGGVGRAAYEAAVAGKPLVATLPNPKRSETLQDGVSGLLFTQEDEDGIAEGIRKLVRDSTFRKTLGASANASIGRRHSPQAIARRMHELYGELVAEPE
jgi:glycosyltransferase involved in cell wall biosynthesis